MTQARWILLGAAVAVAAVALWIGLAYRRDLATARAYASEGSRIAQTKCGAIEYSVRGSGTPVLVIHGAGGGFDQGLMLSEMLHGFQIIAPSRFGYLRTPSPPDASPEAQADAHACLLDELHVARAAVVGVSAGAPSTMQFCLRHAERCSAMVLLVPLLWSDRPPKVERMSPAVQLVVEQTLRSNFAFWAMSHLFRGKMVEAILGTPMEDVEGASPSDQQRIYTMLDRIQPIDVRERGLQNEMLVGQTLRRYELEKFAVPTLIASVENCRYNTYEPARYTAARIPGARFIGYPRGGHLWVGHDAEIAAEVQKFLAEVGAKSGASEQASR